MGTSMVQPVMTDKSSIQEENDKTGKNKTKKTSNKQDENGKTAPEGNEAVKDNTTLQPQNNDNNITAAPSKTTSSGNSNNGKNSSKNGSSSTNKKSSNTKKTVAYKGKYDSYIVNAGDTLSQIVWKQYHSFYYLDKVMKANNIKDSDKIYEGDCIILPDFS